MGAETQRHRGLNEISGAILGGRLGLLINFCVPVLHAGVERVAKRCPE